MDESVDSPDAERPKKAGIFIYEFLTENGATSPSEIHTAYKAHYREFRTLKGKKFRVGTYHSFLIYMRGLERAGLVRKVAGKDPVESPKVAPISTPLLQAVRPVNRTRVNLTPKGAKAPRFVWEHPIRLWDRPDQWERESYPRYTKTESNG